MSFHRKVKALTAFVLAAALALPVGFTASAAQPSTEEILAKYSGESSYFVYSRTHKDTPVGGEQINLNLTSAEFSDDSGIEIGAFEGRENCLIWKNGSGSATFKVSLPADSLYCIKVDYYSVEGKGAVLEYAFTLDGELPFDECAGISFPRIFNYEKDEFLLDNNGNQIRPEHIAVPQWHSYPVQDDEGVFCDPYAFYLTAGEHTITLEALRDPIVISGITLYNPEEDISFEEYSAEHSGKSGKGEAIVIEAEKPYSKTSPMLYPNADRADPATTPSNPVKTRLNNIGGAAWNNRIHEITWEFEVEKAGFYSFGFRYKQNFLRGMSTYRQLLIDGELPYSELSQVAFPYTTAWNGVCTDDYAVWLEEGRHTITLVPTLSVISDVILRTDMCVDTLNACYSRIVAITGTTPDMWRNYYLHESIPELKENFSAVYEELCSISDDMYELTGTKGSEASLIDRICKQLKKFIKSQDAISEQLESFRSNVSSLSSWSLNLQSQSLQLDKLYLLPEGEELPEIKAPFLETLVFHVKSFLGAFVEDYSTVGNTYDEEDGTVITVWTASGRDQADIIKEMIDSDFVPSTGVMVNLQLVQGTLETAVLSGRGPDVSVSGLSPVSLALRDAIVPLDEFSDFREVTGNYPDTILDTFSIKGHTYALPESVNFDMMFYRTDVFDDLGLTPPETWEEMYDVAEVLQRNNMNIGLPADMFSLLVLQMGGRVFNESLTATELTSPTAYKAFEMWTDFYSQYGAPIVKDDYNRFRTGELPLTIITYDFYYKLQASAPEIRNLWKMTEIPGVTKGENTAILTSTSACILSDAEDKEAAWQFLKWWTAGDTQRVYSRKLESVFGIAGRYSPADKGAYSQVAWSGEELKALEAQRDKSLALATVPGEYYVARNITNAFEAVLYNGKNPREALKYWMRQTDNEIARRCDEFGIGDE
ncbi:MAG: extracellular solute-binding protein [Clostridia bacterium]|nr:extracellular solute-binding protein [Clostridia bacterium]